jgi:hypothetical protein
MVNFKDREKDASSLFRALCRELEKPQEAPRRMAGPMAEPSEFEVHSPFQSCAGHHGRNPDIRKS